jgi:GTP-binding protein
VADIPGLIEGAHLGKGLGLQFLKHVERTSILLHLVELSPLLGEDGAEEILEAIRTIEGELQEFSPRVFEKPRIVLFTKADLLPTDFNLEEALTPIREKLSPLPSFIISSASGLGIEQCLKHLFECLRNNRSALDEENDTQENHEDSR